MGLFDLFGRSSKDKEAKRIRDLTKKAHEKYGDPAMRSRALEGLRDIGTPEAIAALIQRFTVHLEPGITDAEEKEYVFGMVTGFGEKAVQPLVDFLRRSDSVAWALRCLEELVPQDELVGILTDLLHKLSQEYARDPEKKVVLINRLVTIRDERIPKAVEPFLEDPSDEVVTAALTNLVEQGSTSSAGAIAACLVGAEAPRVRAGAAAALADLGAPIEANREEVQAKLPAGFQLGKDGVVRRA
ncbi:MAG TPA: HEAT repeat domain-containing protein [Vulgatibacter sp.]|nr:HEAT repeat domain-containing protein [Vulgatibacter sp.]